MAAVFATNLPTFLIRALFLLSLSIPCNISIISFLLEESSLLLLLDSCELVLTVVDAFAIALSHISFSPSVISLIAVTLFSSFSTLFLFIFFLIQSIKNLIRRGIAYKTLLTILSLFPSASV